MRGSASGSQSGAAATLGDAPRGLAAPNRSATVCCSTYVSQCQVHSGSRDTTATAVAATTTAATAAAAAATAAAATVHTNLVQGRSERILDGNVNRGARC